MSSGLLHSSHFLSTRHFFPFNLCLALISFKCGNFFRIFPASPPLFSPLLRESIYCCQLLLSSIELLPFHLFIFYPDTAQPIHPPSTTKHSTGFTSLRLLFCLGLSVFTVSSQMMGYSLSHLLPRLGYSEFSPPAKSSPQISIVVSFPSSPLSYLSLHLLLPLNSW